MLYRAKAPKDIDPSHRYLIIIFKVDYIHHEGDERSRTNPGHGYPAHDELVESSEIYAVVENHQLEKALQELYEKDRLRKDILVIKIGQIVPVAVSLKINLE